MSRETHTIDATDKVLGRLATQIVVLLRGKHKPDFLPYKDEGDFVVAKNIDKLKFTGKKIEKEMRYSHTPYLGGLREFTLKQLVKENPTKIFKEAVYGMLPKNKLRDQQIKRLKFG